MRRLSAVLLLWPLMAGCEATLSDGDAALRGDAGIGDAVVVGALTVPNPGVGIDQLQVKGHQRSDWYPSARLEPEQQPAVYLGVERRSLPRQMTIQDARVYHLGFHFTWQDFRGGTPPGYYWGGRDESMCAYFPECLQGVARDEPTLDWVGPIFVVFEYHGAPHFDPADADQYSDEELAQLGYPFENYMYQLEMSTEFVPREMIFGPDDLQGDHPTLRDAVLEDGWPTMQELDGKFIFIMKAPPELDRVYLDEQWVSRFFYEPGDPRVFVAADSPEDDHAAFFSLFGAEEAERVGPLVEQGFIVHGAAEEPAGVRAYEEAGAQLLTAVHLDQMSFMGPARCNPATADPQCYEPAPVGHGNDVAP